MKKMLSLALCLLIAITSIVPAFGQELQVSPWAIEVLNEGEAYGIYPHAWYTDGFLNPIGQDRFARLLLNVSRKLESAGIEGNPEFEPISVSETLTRGEVAKGFYNLLAYYGLTEETDPVKALTTLNVLRGNGQSLALDAPCTVEQATVMAIRLVYEAFDALSLGAKGLMWEVNKGDTTVYLLGSIHLGTTGLYPLDARILRALQASDVLWVEANVLDQHTGMAEFYEIAMLPEGETLESKLAPELYEKIVMVYESMGVPAENLSGFKPWFISNNLNAMVMQDGINEGLDASDEEAVATATRGLDVYFLLNAMLTGKPVGELEGVAAQAMMFDGLSDEVVSKHLEAILDMILNDDSEEATSADEMNALLASWFEFWRTGDVDGFTESFAAAQEPENEFTQMLFGARDVYMAERIHELLTSETAGKHFVVVGAGHLIGDLSIIENLKKMGYEVNVY